MKSVQIVRQASNASLSSEESEKVFELIVKKSTKPEKPPKNFSKKIGEKPKSEKVLEKKSEKKIYPVKDHSTIEDRIRIGFERLRDCIYHLIISYNL